MDSNGYGLNLTREMSYMTPMANSPLLMPLLLSLMTDPHTPYTRDTFQQDYDYVIVGGGTAGSALASRLTEDSSVTVLLLEAGLHSPILTDVPGIDQTWWYTDIDWQYFTTPQKHTGFGILDNKLPFPSGKALGGTSIINAMLYLRGNHHNFDQWAEMGAEGWSYEEVLPYFKKSENNDNPEYTATRYHSIGGLLSIETPHYGMESREAVFKAAEELGYRIGDVNGERQLGFTNLQRAMRNQQRCNAAKAFLVPAENRTNLDIVVGAHVTKILIEGTPLEAVGVNFDHAGESHTVKAKKEVILSAGTVNSAQLLLLSGVGPTEELVKHNIEVLVDLPVGKNFMDHQASLMNYLLDPSLELYETRFVDPKNLEAYINNRTGPLTLSVAVEVAAFINGDEVSPEEDISNCQVYFLQAEVNGYRDVYKFLPKIYDPYFKPNEKKPVLNCVAQLVQPKSRGTVTLNSTDPYDPPLIDPNYFDDPQDMKDMVDGLKLCQKLLQTESMKNLGMKMFDEKFPGCESLFEDEDAYLACIAKYAIFTTNHQVGTAKMGDPTDPTTVVDPRLRVKGVKSLRVVDASIMPVVSSGNTMTPVYMIAEKAADMIKEDMNTEN